MKLMLKSDMYPMVYWIFAKTAILNNSEVKGAPRPLRLCAMC